MSRNRKNRNKSVQTNQNSIAQNNTVPTQKTEKSNKQLNIEKTIEDDVKEKFKETDSNESSVQTINTITPIEEKKIREKIDIMGVKIPIFCITLFIIVLAYGGYITPILLMAGVLLIAKIDSKKLTSNFLVVLALYASQFVIETLITFIASLPSKIIEWLTEMVSTPKSLEILSNISKSCTAFFDIASGFVALLFFVLYILSVISLFKSDKIRIPIVTDIVKKIVN